ncbi:MAG: hypothetical protein LBS36_07570 [Oscillospiraceae bacterium]|jgi:hypothetical protein|nr:hypothetical protein [Oscillospiraceae bacterium]
MISEKRKQLQKQLEESIQSKNPFTGAACIGPYMQEISMDFSETIGPINEVVAPFLIAVLEIYAEIKKEPTMIFKVVVPRGR